MDAAARLGQVEEVFHAALQHAPQERAAFLAEACAKDEALRLEVESLLQADEKARSFIEAPAYQLAATSLANSSFTSLIEQTFGHHRILALLGKGGMGEVYLAEDTRLGRRVALKLLPAEFTSDAERLRRFRQEARAASALNHPNIVTIHDVGEADGRHFITTEYIDGVTLRQRLAEGVLDLSTALEVALQVAAGLAAAHEAGIVHRDIKPENVMLRRDGLVKVLDFGLAKLTERPLATLDTGAPTKLASGTEPGLVLGTLHYMSPEQARGQKVDSRTDIFSLGVVLYEMVAGERPFAGATPSDVLAAILRTEPKPLARADQPAPRQLEQIVSRALCKAREERYQTINELLAALKELKEELALAARLQRAGAADTGNQEQTAPAVQMDGARADTATDTPAQTSSSAEVILTEIKRHKRGVTLALAVLLALIAGAGWGLYTYVTRLQSQARPEGPVAQIAPLTSFLGNEHYPSFSPDGNQIAFVWDGEKGDNQDIYVKQVGTGALLRLTTNSAADLYPSWSPDGRYLAFLRRTEEGDALYLTASLGGAERRITELTRVHDSPPGSVAWSPDGEWLAVTDRSSSLEPFAIFLVARETGEKHRLSAPPAGSGGDRQPSISPDGKTVAFTRFGGGAVRDVYVMPLAGGEARRLTFENGNVSFPAWTPDGRAILYLATVTNTGVWTMPALGGKPERIEAAGQDIITFAISRQGDRLVWSQATRDSNIWQIELAGGPTPIGQKQSAKLLISSTRDEVAPQFSPDGRSIAFASNRSGRDNEIWVCSSDGQHPVQLTFFNRSLTGAPHWSTDGRQIALVGRAEGSADIYVINAEGGKPRRLTTESSQDVAPSWSRDGQWIYFCSDRSDGWQIWKLPAAGGSAVQVTRQGGFDSMESLDGKFLYFRKGRNMPGPGFWRQPTAGGAETLVFDEHQAGYWPQWVVVEQGIYFVTAETPDLPRIEFFSFATGKINTVVTLEKRLAGANSHSLSISPDGRRLLWAQVDQTNSDLMLMENFR